MRNSLPGLPPQPQPEACAGIVLKCTVVSRARTAPAITPNLVSCVFTTPSSASARIPKIARSPRKPSASISNRRKPRVSRDFARRSRLRHPIRRAAPPPGQDFFFSSHQLPSPLGLRLNSRSPRDPPRPRLRASQGCRCRNLPRPGILTVASFPPFPLPNSQSHQPVTLSLRHHSPRIVFFLHLRAIFFCPV